MGLIEEMKGKCICRNCCPTRYFTKEDFKELEHRCPVCGKALDINLNEDGESYLAGMVNFTDLEVGDYILMFSHFHQIVKIDENVNKENHIYIAMFNFRGGFYNINDEVFKIID